MKPAVLSTLGVLLLIFGIAPAHAERVAKPVCKIIRIADAGILQQCDGQLRSFALSTPALNEPRYATYQQIQIYLQTRILSRRAEHYGWFVDPKGWAEQTGRAYDFRSIRRMVGWKLLGSEQHVRSIFKPSCKLSDVTLAGMPGQMICYEVKSADAASSTVVMVVADEDVGLVVTFPGPDLKDVLDYAVSSLRGLGASEGVATRVGKMVAVMKSNVSAPGRAFGLTLSTASLLLAATAIGTVSAQTLFVFTDRQRSAARCGVGMALRRPLPNDVHMFLCEQASCIPGSKVSYRFYAAGDPMTLEGHFRKAQAELQAAK